MAEIHPSLSFVNEARAEGIKGHYDECLSAYANAKREAEKEISSSRNIQEKSRWNSLVKDIVQEEAAIRRLKNTIHEITHLMNVDDQHRISQQEIERNVQNASRERLLQQQQFQQQQNDYIISPMRKRLRQADKKKIQRYSAPPKLESPKRQNRNPFDDKPPGSPLKQRALIARKPIQGLQQQQQQQPNQNVEQKKKDLPNADNPLIQQIIDMGILVRDPNVEWDSIAGLKQVKRLLRQNLVILPMRPDICKGLLSPWRSVLFYGPPGTGKTFLAKAVATECKRTFFNVTSATITSRFLGESEKLVSYLFDLAEQMQPSTIFFDEIDSIASQRGKEGENESSRRMKAQLLTKLEGIDSNQDSSSVFVMAATNFPWDLDEALLRRFQKRVYIPLPDAEGREAILKMHIGEMMDSNFNLPLFVKKLDGYSCADIANLCKDVAQYVFDKQTKDLDTQQWLNMPVEDANVVVTNADFEMAMKKRKSSVDPASIKKYEQWRDLKAAE